MEPFGLMQRKCRVFQNSKNCTLYFSVKRDVKTESSFSFLQLKIQRFNVFCSEPESSSRAKNHKIHKNHSFFFGTILFSPSCIHGYSTKLTRVWKTGFGFSISFNSNRVLLPQWKRDWPKEKWSMLDVVEDHKSLRCTKTHTWKLDAFWRYAARGKSLQHLAYEISYSSMGFRTPKAYEISDFL